MKILVTAFLILFIVTDVYAQITLSESNFVSGHVKNAGAMGFSAQNPSVLRPNLVVTGANQEWDFSAATYGSPQSNTDEFRALPYPSGAFHANDPEFQSATNVFQMIVPALSDTESFFYQADPTEALFLGYADHDSAGDHAISAQSPGQKIAVFPLTYQTSWQSTFTTADTFFSTFIKSSDSTVYLDTYLADGWGTLMTPSGSFQTLRITEKDSVLRSTTQTTGNYTYSWYTADGFLRAVIGADLKGNIVAATYYVPPSNSVNASTLSSHSSLTLELSRNFISAGATLFYSLPLAGAVHMELIDEMGRSQLLKNGFAHEGRNELSFDSQSLAPGMYFIRLEQGGQTALTKLCVAR